MSPIADFRFKIAQIFCCHKWEEHQHFFEADGYHGPGAICVVIAWKQCRKCAKSKLAHILK